MKKSLTLTGWTFSGLLTPLLKILETWHNYTLSKKGPKNI